MSSNGVRHRPFDARDVRAAEELVHRLLHPLPERIRHSSAVAAKAVSLAGAVDDDQVNLLVASAWLHDIGYSPDVSETGFHPLDGARFLRSAGWDVRLCALVAHHSGSRFLATHWGLGAALSEFRFVQDAVSDALTIADQAVGPNGGRFTLEERMLEVLRRHGPESPQAKAHPQRAAYFLAASGRVDARLAMRDLRDAGERDPGSARNGGRTVRPRLLLPAPRRSSGPDLRGRPAQ